MSENTSNPVPDITTPLLLSDEHLSDFEDDISQVPVRNSPKRCTKRKRQVEDDIDNIDDVDEDGFITPPPPEPKECPGAPKRSKKNNV